MNKQAVDDCINACARFLRAAAQLGPADYEFVQRGLGSQRTADLRREAIMLRQQLDKLRR